MAKRPCQPHRPSGELLRRLEVRPIGPAERSEWDRLVDEHHYLGLLLLAMLNR